MGAEVHLDTSGAHKALDDLIAKAKKARSAAKTPLADDKLDPSAVAQAQRRYERRNGVR